MENKAICSPKDMVNTFISWKKQQETEFYFYDLSIGYLIIIKCFKQGNNKQAD